MAARLLALFSLVALATSLPTPAPDNASPVPSETSNVSPTVPSNKDKSGDSNEESKPSVEIEQFLKDMVNKINKYRLMHAASALVLSLKLTNKAELWAVKLANKDQEELNTNTKFGQAIFSSSNPENVVNASVESWYNQIVHYRFDQPKANQKTNYFTQLVWRTTSEVGIGKASSGSGKTYIVAYFSPPGNNGDLLNNVLPVTGSGVGKRGLANCTDGYKHYNNSCFKLFPGPRTWESAVHKCTQEFASLASVDSDAENYFIKSLLTEHKKNFTWIGLGDPDNDNTFRWVDGTSNVFTKWEYDQSLVQGKKCVVVGESFNWKYVPCDKGVSFVCRRRLRDISIYEVVFLYLNKLWTDKLLSPEEARYKSLKTHIENAIFETYRDDDYFDEVDFKRFSKNEEGRILATVRIHFTPDDDSPLDPLERLRNRLQGGSGGESTKRTVIKGVLSGEPVEIVNTSLVIEHPQPVLCPGFCTIQHCPATICTQSCCNQNSLQQNPLGALGSAGAQTQQPYQQNPYQSNPYQANPYQTNPYQSNPYQANPYQTNPYQSNPYQANPYQTNPYQTNPYQAYPQTSQSNYPYTGYSGPSSPQGGAQVAPKPGGQPEEKPESKPEEKPDEKTKPSSSNEEDEAPKEPKEQTNPQISRPPRPASQPVGYPSQPSPSGYPGNYPGAYGKTYPQQQAQSSSYQAAYASMYPYNQQPGYSQQQPYVQQQPYRQQQPNQPYGSSYPSSSSPASQGQDSRYGKEKPGRAKGKKGHKKRPRPSGQRPYPYPGYQQQGYPGTYSTGYPGYQYPGQTAQQGITQIPSYMSAASSYTNQAAGTGYPSVYGTSSYGGYPSTSTYQGTGYTTTMGGQDPNSAQGCVGSCANSCAPQCSQACCRSRGMRRRPQ